MGSGKLPGYDESSNQSGSFQGQAAKLWKPETLYLIPPAFSAVT
jgi:hypothetical protein